MKMELGSTIKYAVIGIAVLLGVGLIVILISNSFTQGMIVAAVILILIFIWLARKESQAQNPKLKMKENIEQACLANAGAELKDLYLTGGVSEDETGKVTRTFQQVKKGRLLGWSCWIIKDEKKEKTEIETERLYFFYYSPKFSFLYKLPFFSALAPKKLLLAYPRQIITTDFAAGMDIYLKGASTRIVEFFEVINELALADDDKLYSSLDKETDRITLGMFFGEKKIIIDDAVKSSGRHKKLLDLKDEVVG